MRKLTITIGAAAAMLLPAAAKASDIQTSASPYSCDGDELYCNPAVGGQDVIDWAAVGAAPVVQASVPAAPDATTVTNVAPVPAPAGAGGLLGCILQRESNNGLTSSNVAQFQQSTWIADGGGVYAPTPSAASYSQQVAVVSAQLAAGNSSQWTQWDGC